MLKVYIGPNGFGKSYAINQEIERLFNEDKERKDIIKLNSEIVFEDEMKDTVNNSFVMEYLIAELLENDKIVEAKMEYEGLLDKSINDNQKIYDDLMDEVLRLNNQTRTKNVISTTKTKEHKKIVKINSDDLKNKMGSGQKLQFLLKLIKRSNKKYIYLDEPENHTHPSLLNVTAGLINELSQEKEVCIATHSPELLNLLNINFDNIFIFNDPNFGEPKKLDFNSAITLPKTIHIENLNNKSKSYYDASSLKKNILDIHKKEFMAALFTKKVYLIEGINDRLFLKKLLNHYGKQYSQYEIFHCYGKPHYLPFINLFTSVGIDVIPIFDRDDESDINNVAINNEMKKCSKYYEFNDNLEHELNYKGRKDNTPDYIEFLDNYSNYENYKEIVL